MSYPRDLDEIPEDELVDEIDRRKRLRRRGLCDYCERPPDTTSCKFPGRHRADEVKARAREKAARAKESAR